MNVSLALGIAVEPAPLESPVCRDPNDDTILATALAGGADCIATGDKDLLALKKFGAIDILSPSEFEVYEEQFTTDAE
ncbi:putative toxin-antitoxin system toxin component, PIN family [Kovacikia minuta CCNUW1]|uniref:putative toxin-antitoxin system toxin component, PIN family n=1 Tax=Kovacikia minuta TaxID=2931930 RepID=UPI001CC90A24|nr:putative toxin-antitoxin system toxin component, PIN family [Kovacikia minuta]UBF26661.1 putative toxin-antitoxin system toxin component, PIN family [Kovacikia minuta CCNUW1]